MPPHAEHHIEERHWKDEVRRLNQLLDHAPKDVQLRFRANCAESIFNRLGIEYLLAWRVLESCRWLADGTASRRVHKRAVQRLRTITHLLTAPKYRNGNAIRILTEYCVKDAALYARASCQTTEERDNFRLYQLQMLEGLLGHTQAHRLNLLWMLGARALGLCEALERELAESEGALFGE